MIIIIITCITIISIFCNVSGCESARIHCHGDYLHGPRCFGQSVSYICQHPISRAWRRHHHHYRRIRWRQSFQSQSGGFVLSTEPVNHWNGHFRWSACTAVGGAKRIRY